MSYFVYIIGHFDSDRPCKVGISANPEARKAQLQTANPKPLALLWTIACETKEEAAAKERSIHLQFAERRLSGEWLDASAEEIMGADWSALPDKRPNRRSVQGYSFDTFEPFRPSPPENLAGKSKRDMTFSERCQYWEAFDLPPPPDGFDDWYVIGNSRMGVIGAFPVKGFMDEDDAE